MSTTSRTRWLAVASSALLLTLGVGAAPASALGVPIITGHVTADGVDVEGLLIQAIPDVFGDPFITDTTAVDGTYHLDDVPDGDYSVQIFDPASDWKYEASVPVTISSGTPTAVVDFELDAWPVGTSTVHGVLTDSTTSTPIAGAIVNFSGSGTAKDAAATTGPTGDFSFALLPGGFFTLYVAEPGYVNKNVSFTLDEADDLELNIAITQANAQISGSITDTSSNPILDDLWVQYSLDSDPDVSGGALATGGSYSLLDLGAGTYTVRMGGPGTGWTGKRA